MSGILDNKKRIMETILTPEGKRQLSKGDFKIRYVTFSDHNSFYKKDENQGAEDASLRLYLEPSLLPQDNITLHSDESGRLNPFDYEGIQLKGDAILSGSGRIVDKVTIDNMASNVNTLISSSIDHISKNRIIGTKEYFGDHTQFAIDKKNITFVINNNEPFRQEARKSVYVSDAESFFEDKKVASDKRFYFMPPINRKFTDTDEEVPLGDYGEDILADQREDSLLKIERSISGFEKFEINFLKNSVSSNIIGQAFCKNKSKFDKLDVLNAGSYFDPRNKIEKDIYYVGKVLIDESGSSTFINLFTLIFEWRKIESFY